MAERFPEAYTLIRKAEEQNADLLHQWCRSLKGYQLEDCLLLPDLAKARQAVALFEALLAIPEDERIKRWG
jgi:hypothetical protein